MSQKRVVELTDDQRRQCLELVRRGTAAARSIMHAQILLKADAGPVGACGYCLIGWWSLATWTRCRTAPSGGP